MILFIAIALGVFAFAIVKAIKIVKYPMPGTLNYPSEIKNLLFLVIGIAVSTVLIFVFLAMFQLYTLNPGEWASLIFGALIFGLSVPIFTLSFILHYYGKEVDPKSDKVLFISIIASAFTFLLGIWLLTNGIADHIIYPLVNGLNFTHGWVNPSGEFSGGGITWYALCILTGAVIVYFICDHRFYREYGKHGILESLFFVAFPAGIIGARVGYVIGEWNHGPNSFAERVAKGQWWSIFAVWEGGLTIISGALIGIIVGIAWFLWRNKKYSIWLAMDVIIPCVLVAQAFGRWGNFFNCEVHGLEVAASNWAFLPKIILNNAMYSQSAGWAAEGNIYVPLFLIESITNMLGYFIIRFAIGKGLRHYIEMGDLSASYIIWYGLTRVIMEPMRHPAYNMGNDGYWSWMWSIIFVLGGAFLIMVNHIVRYLIRKHKGEAMITKVSLPLWYSASGMILAGGLALTILGAYYMSTSVQSVFLGFNRYNNGFILLTVGLSLLLILVCAILYFVQYMDAKRIDTLNNEN